MPIAGNPGLSDFDLNPQELGQLLGELSVYRDTFSRGWTGSAETLEAILDVLTPCEHVKQTYAMELQPFTTLHQPAHGLALR